MKNILLVDDYVSTYLKYKRWIEDKDLFNFNKRSIIGSSFKSINYDLVLIGFRMSVIDGFNLYDKT